MSWYRRRYVKGGTYFFTVVTHLRRPILTTDLARPLLRESFAQQRLHQVRVLLALKSSTRPLTIEEITMATALETRPGRGGPGGEVEE